MAHYRIVEDKYAGYEVQIWRWWLPFWIEVGFANTHFSIEDAEKYARRHANNGGAVKFLGKLP